MNVARMSREVEPVRIIRELHEPGRTETGIALETTRSQSYTHGGPRVWASIAEVTA